MWLLVNFEEMTLCESLQIYVSPILKHIGIYYKSFNYIFLIVYRDLLLEGINEL